MREPGKTTRIRLSGLFRGADTEAGISAVEFALAAPVFLSMVLGIIDLGRAGFAQAVMFKAAQETSRWIVINPRDVTNGESTAQYETRIETEAETRLNALTGSAPVADATAVPNAATNPTTTTVNLTISYDFDWLMPWVVGGNTTFTSHSNAFTVEDI